MVNLINSSLTHLSHQNGRKWSKVYSFTNK